jgi:hypothetical protein
MLPKLKDGDCEFVRSKTASIIAASPNPAVLAAAHLYHALAVGCLGGDAAAEIRQVRTDASVLDGTSREIVARIATAGVPQNLAQVRSVLPATLPTTSTLTESTSTTTRTE